MHEVVSFEEIMKMHPEKLTSEGGENIGKILKPLRWKEDEIER